MKGTVLPATCTVILCGPLLAAEPQNPSPMVEHTREHPRLKMERLEGKREDLTVGTLFIPAPLAGKEAPLLIFMHGGAWIPEVAAARHGMAALTIQRGDGYKAPSENAEAFGTLLAEAKSAAHMRWTTVCLAGWSAGCQGVRQILRSEAAREAIDSVIMIDGIHSSYLGGKPGPLESEIDTVPLEPIVAFAREALAGRKRMIITHSEVFPGTFASTTETADWLLRTIEIKREAILRWGP